MDRVINNVSLCQVPNCNGTGHTRGSFSNHRSHNSCPILAALKESDPIRAKMILADIKKQKDLANGMASASEGPSMFIAGPSNHTASSALNQHEVDEKKPAKTTATATNNASPVGLQAKMAKTLAKKSLMKRKTSTAGEGDGGSNSASSKAKKAKLGILNMINKNKQNASRNQGAASTSGKKMPADAAYDKVVNHYGGDEDTALARASQSGSEGMCNVSPKSVLATQEYMQQMKQITANLKDDLKLLLTMQSDLRCKIQIKQEDIITFRNIYTETLDRWRRFSSGIVINIDGVMVKADDTDDFILFLGELCKVTNRPCPDAEASAISRIIVKNWQKDGIIEEEVEIEDSLNSFEDEENRPPAIEESDESVQAAKVDIYIDENGSQMELNGGSSEVILDSGSDVRSLSESEEALGDDEVVVMEGGGMPALQMDQSISMSKMAMSSHKFAIVP